MRRITETSEFLSGTVLVALGAVITILGLVAFYNYSQVCYVNPGGFPCIDRYEVGLLAPLFPMASLLALIGMTVTFDGFILALLGYQDAMEEPRFSMNTMFQLGLIAAVTGMALFAWDLWRLNQPVFGCPPSGCGGADLWRVFGPYWMLDSFGIASAVAGLLLILSSMRRTKAPGPSGTMIRNAGGSEKCHACLGTTWRR